MRPTLKMIARRLGVNPSTVSRALRDDPWVSAETKQRVKKVAEELEYRPNAVLSELAASRWQSGKIQETVIAYVLRTPREAVHGVNLIGYLKAHAERMGYRLEPFFREDYVSSAKLQRVLRNRGITDIILGPILDESFKVELDWENFICIQLLPGFFPLPLHVVMRDHFNIVIMTWEKCVSRGYKRIGITLLNHRNRLMDDVVRMSAVDACQKYMFSHLPAIAPHHFEENNWREKEFILWVKKNRLDVVIGFNDYALLLLDQGFGRGFPFCSLNIVPPETSSGVTEASEDQGREAINLLHFCRRTNQWGLPEHRIGHVIEPQWTEGASLPLKKDVVFSYPYARAEGTSDG